MQPSHSTRWEILHDGEKVRHQSVAKDFDGFLTEASPFDEIWVVQFVPVQTVNTLMMWFTVQDRLEAPSTMREQQWTSPLVMSLSTKVKSSQHECKYLILALKPILDFNDGLSISKGESSMMVIPEIPNSNLKLL